MSDNGIALLGGGVFARSAHLPALYGVPEFSLKAVWSRSEASAKATLEDAEKLGFKDVQLYHESGKDDLSSLLARKDVKTVVLALPIPHQADVIKLAFEAGKNVISEKPAAKDVATARALVEMFEKEHATKGLSWIIAEQYPYEPGYVEARRIMASGQLGTLRSFTMEWLHFVAPDWKYQTEWRKEPSHQGGYLLDGGVHNAAALRYILGAYNGTTMTEVTAATAFHHEHLPPADTMQGLIKTSAGVTGTFTLAVSHEQRSPAAYVFHGSKAIMTVQMHFNPKAMRLDYKVSIKSNEQGVFSIGDFDGIGVAEEFKAFAKALAAGSDSEEMKDVLSRSGPRQGLADVAVIEGMLKSAESGRWVALASL